MTETILFEPIKCKHRYFFEGYRTYGNNIPYYAQGSYFPGDEPGWLCKLEGFECNEEGPDGGVEDCPCKTDWPVEIDE